MPAARSTHIISKLTLEVNSAQQEHGQALQGKLVEMMKASLLPALERELDELGSDQHLRIERLELRLQNIKDSEMIKDLPRRILSEMRSEISRLVREQATRLKSNDNEDAIIYYLRTGMWPWWSKPIAARDWQQQLSNELADAKRTARLNALQQLIVNDVVARQRLVYMTSDHFLNGLIDAFGNRRLSEFNRSILNIPSFLPLSIPRRAARNIVFTHSMAALNVQQATKFEQKLFDKIFKNWLHQQNHHSEKSLLQYLINKLPQINLRDPRTGAWLDKMLGNKVHTAVKPGELVDNDRPAFNIQEENTAIFEDVSRYINNAGLVLLHPYLEYFFKSQSLLKNDGFVNAQNRHKAILLLHYLSTGNTRGEDSELLFNKLLCGQAIHLPVDTGIRLNRKAVTEADQLLKSVITHWPKLKNTSPTGLRNSFIQRDGKLIQKDNLEWKLKVDRKTEDLLLQDVPWSFNIIKLPWMTKILWVDW